MKVAFVYDRVNKFGGAEKVLLSLAKLWPQAPLYTLVYNDKKAIWSRKFKVIPAINIPFLASAHEFLPLLAARSFAAFDLSGFDIVISVTSAEAKQVHCPASLHICYCLTPTRYLWSGWHEYLANPGFGKLDLIARQVLTLAGPSMRFADYMAAQRPDYFVAISKTVQKRIAKYYRRKSTVIYPPVSFSLQEVLLQGEEEYYLVVSRLVPYKRIDLIISAFNDLGFRLKIVGVGNQIKYLRSLAGPKIEFLGLVGESKLAKLYSGCQALVIAAQEDFGLSAVEAQAAGKPVIGPDSGGIAETVVDGKTGVLYHSGSLKLAIQRASRIKFNSSVCRKQASKFSEAIFLQKFKNFVEDKWKEKQKRQK